MDAAVTLRTARHRAGLSQAELARRTGTSQATISAYEAGRKDPALSTFARLLAATGTRLAAEPSGPVRVPARAELARAGRQLEQVIELAAALPTRHAELPRPAWR